MNRSGGGGLGWQSWKSFFKEIITKITEYLEGNLVLGWEQITHSHTTCMYNVYRLASRIQYT